ncbi:hypothetical protein K9B33_18720 [Sphingobium sp. 3R8]|uniref:hypothetical protein n=1 Tax=Sphingobium sp. 3R8 TaxID=2874921 RepID=UPI001CCCF947|nr:hypothetical protein [Sphingobium sp. 3R8]MBZ9649574.1 hypothetical protein [Sphingobium sp. 3R8]
MTPKQIIEQKKLNKQSGEIAIPKVFTDKFPDLKAAKAQTLFDRYVEAVCGALARQAPFITDNRAQVSLDALSKQCGIFEYKKKRHSVWTEFREICPLFVVIDKGNNLKGRNTTIQINDRTIRKLLDYVSDDVLVQEVFSGAASDGAKPEMIAVDLENLKNYIDNTDYDLAHNAEGKGSEWVAKVQRNAYQARLVQRIAAHLGGQYPQYPKPSVFGRTYYHGLSIQTMSKQVRAAVLGEHYQYDLSAAIYGIKLAIISGIVAKPNERHVENRLDGLFTYTKEYLREKDAIRQRLADQCLTATPIKAAGKLRLVKQAITAIGFGAKTDAALWHDGHPTALADILRNKDDRERFLNDKFVINFIAEQDELTEAIISHLKRVGQFDPIKQAIRDAKAIPRITDAHILAYLFQHYETSLMDDIVAIAQAERPVVARIHDAFVTSDKLSEATQAAIAEKLREAHSLIRIECERVTGWQSADARRKNEEAEQREAEHMAAIADEDRRARAWASGEGSDVFAMFK